MFPVMIPPCVNHARGIQTPPVLARKEMEEMKERGNWASWLEFVLSMLGYMVGLGNVWRFPYVCYINGGAAFLLPYLVAMAVCGVPIFLLETTVCQFSNLSPAKLWVLCPLFRGIGYGMIVLTSVVMVYYNVIIAWTLYYLIMSFRDPLPWTSCDSWWNIPSCVSPGHQGQPEDQQPAHNLSATLTHTSSAILEAATNGTNMTSVNVTTGVAKAQSSVEQFWSYHVLQDTDHGISDLGDIRWQLLLSLLCAWVLVFFCLFKDIKSSGKVMYVTAVVPYFILLALLIRGCLLPGAVDGVLFYLSPQWSRLLDWKVWLAASVQAFYSVGIGGGSMGTLSSFNRFHNNVCRDAIFLPTLDAVTSVFVGFVIFVYLGYMAHMQNTTVDAVVSEGTGLAFIAYPDALASMPLPQLWAVLFFLVLFTVGLASQVVHVQTITSAMVDIWPRLLGHRKRWLTLIVCIVGFVFGLPFVTQGGQELLKLCDWYLAEVSIMLLAVGEDLALAWVYGSDRLYSDICLMIGYRPGPVWHVLWKVITPGFTLATWTLGMVGWRPIPGFPMWTMGVGWVIAVSPLLPIPIFAVLQLMITPGTVKERFLVAIKPTAQWKPAISQQDQEEGQALA